ncbi:hypothetical protein OOZ19_15050 [Saccharopolyspora sp. NFXS83]|uniref:hypothetical protein n=1 Tax=Saccharopolyspora sp. NFXS83 TaxID=2993560 RepID=UPI00224AF0CC|nr:hypothetical protein [Saccharopolyspora sp. NFXS83]MCX2731560.1 hypothetical protein [Saccharopolyspora sp. NFXS83]
MRVVRLGKEPTKIGADIRAAIAAWGPGSGVFGGVAVFGAEPPGAPRTLDAVLVLPRGIVVVVGTDLPESALTLEAPVQTPWTVDGWPLLRQTAAMNPALEALESAAALARALQSRDAEPMPVAAIVAVGPYVAQITQPTNDLYRGVRVLYPSTTSMLAAARELATYERACGVEPARKVLRILDERAGRISVADLTAEGFPDSVTPDLASASTLLIPKVRDEAPAPVPAAAPNALRARLSGLSRRTVLTALGVAAVVLTGAVLSSVWAGGSGSAQDMTAQQVDGVSFERTAAELGGDCAEASFGDVRAWFQRHPCEALSRQVFDSEAASRTATVSLAVVDLGDATPARNLRELLNTPGSGGISDPAAEPGPPTEFDGAAQAVQQTGSQVRIVQAAWASGKSDPGDVSLRVLAERGLRLRTPE